VVEYPVRAAWKWAVILEWANPVKFPRSLPEPVSPGVPRPALFLDLTRILDKVILSCAVCPASTQMASSLSRTPPSWSGRSADEMTRYRCPFWLAVLLTGIGTGVAAAALTRLLEMVQHVVWNGSGTHLLEAAGHAGAWWKKAHRSS
jgi:hypothetical protein